jgi:energy-converting hydrogenase Eha subunit A
VTPTASVEAVHVSVNVVGVRVLEARELGAVGAVMSAVVTVFVAEVERLPAASTALTVNV